MTHANGHRNGHPDGAYADRPRLLSFLDDRLPPQNIEGTRYGPIEGFPGYAVGDDGSVWSCRAKVQGGLSDRWIRMKPGVGHRGHLRVTLNWYGRKRQAFVHHLVLEAFVGPCPPGMEGCHAPDPDPSNNRLENLRWDTRAANHRDSVELGRHAHGERHGCCKLKAADVVEIRRMRAAGSEQQEIAERFGVSQVMISRILRGKAWTHVPGGETVSYQVNKKVPNCDNCGRLTSWAKAHVEFVTPDTSFSSEDYDVLCPKCWEKEKAVRDARMAARMAKAVSR